ncbi:head-tail connector protein [Woodsholea maritima]|uniref:head-tail connector protein n=1 Tax=Woodsholea maritima TaxID=240237 RepID=UPI0003618AD5|nr:phage head-tail connector protein [Woodsholea maritima]
MSLYPLAQPVLEPVSVADIQSFLRISPDHDQELIVGLIRASREFVERFTARALITRSYSWTFDAWPCEGALRLPRGPGGSIIALERLDRAEGWQSLSIAPLRLEDDQIIAPAGTIRPDMPRAGLRLTFTAGYGPAAEDVPEIYRQGIRLGVSALYAEASAPESAARGDGRFEALKDWLSPLKAVRL